jgi:aryl carrier-like protein
MEAAGTRVVVRRGDVASAADVSGWLAEIDRELPPLRGVIHAAMVLEDALLMNLDRPLMERVLAPKVDGTWNLHVQTAGRSLEHFVMFSSLSSVFGHAGQGNYAAANAFLDGLAWHRRALGLPALTVNWGYLGDVGYLARRSELGGRLERQGVLSFSIDEALALLEKALQRELVQVSVMRLEWSRWRGLGVTSRVSPRFAHLCRPEEGGSGGAAGGMRSGREAVEAAAPSDRAEILGSLLRQKVASVLGASPERLEADRPLLQLGLDSLMAVELRNWIEGELKVNLPIVELMRSPSLAKLADLLADQFGGGAETAGVRGDSPALEVSVPGGSGLAAEPQILTEEWLAQVEGLSGEEVDALLTSLLNERGQIASR